MTSEENQWEVNLVRDRYQTLNLTYEQAEKVYKYEEEKNTYSEKHFFSAWEEWDYELTVFKEIFNDEQFKDYRTWLNNNIQRYEQDLIDQDAKRTNEIAYQEEQINFYENQFLPDFFRDHFLHGVFYLDDKTKIDYLRAEYKRFLNDTKKEILTSHFRHNRTFKPNQLKVSLLRHKISCIFPDYRHFKHQMDEPTKAVANFLEAKLRYLPENIEELFALKSKDLKEYHDALFEKYYSDKSGWYIVIGSPTDQEEKANRYMSFLLMDKNKYGLTTI